MNVHPDCTGRNHPNHLHSCTAHKDNIHWWGPRTAAAPSP
jgi:hypothetical protein